MMKNLCIILLGISLIACDDKVTVTRNTPANDITNSTDQSIINIVNSGQRTPAGFFQLVFPTDDFYTVRHLKDIDIGGTGQYELSADSYDQALTWDTTAGGEQMIDPTVTELFYQFSHNGSQEPTKYIWHRVFNSNIIDRAGVSDRNCSNCYYGNLNPSWLLPSRVKYIIEYLWVFTFENNAGNVVLQSSTREYVYTYEHTIERATFDPTIACGPITIYENLYVVDKTTGDIQKSSNFIREINSRC